MEDKFIKTDKYEIYNYDCIEMMDLLIAEGKQIDLTVTSPPYDDLRDYENSLVWNFDIFKQVARRLYDITKDGGVVVWIVADMTKNFSETGNSFKQALYFKEIGFNLLDTMIYLKDNYPPAYPTMRRYANQFEYMFVLSKGKPSVFNPKKVPKNAKRQGVRKFRQKDGSQVEKIVNNDYEYKNATNVWNYSTGGSCTTDKFAFKHPAIFPEKLAEDHILSWSNEGDTVLDCFMGSCTTGKMALLNNRKFIGIEKVEDYFEISKQRIEGIKKVNK